MTENSPNILRTVVAWKLEWKGNNYIHKSGAMDDVLKRVTSETFPVESYTQKHGRLWTVVTKEQLVRLIQKNRGIYEIFPAEGKRKVYFDVDKGEKALEEAKELILSKFPGANMHVSGRNALHGQPDSESSWHITLSNYYAMNLAAMAPVRELCREWKEYGFDPVVYMKNQNYKCINQSKPDKPIQEYLEGSQELSKHLIMHDFDEEAIDIATMDLGFKEVVARLQKKTKYSTVLDILAIPQSELPSPDNFDWLTASPLDKLSILPCPKRGTLGCLSHLLCWQIMLWCGGVGITFPQFWAWNKQKDENLTRYQKYKNSWDQRKEEYHVKQGFMDVLLQRVYPKIQETKVTAKLRAQFDLEETTVIEGRDGKFLSADDISVDKKWTYLISSMGSNKTGAVVEYLKQHGPGKRVLWLTPRITLSQNTGQRLKVEWVAFECYKDVSKRDKDKGVLDSKERIICSIQSLHYLAKEFDIIVADEIETLLLTFEGNATTHQKHLDGNWDIFKMLCKQAKKIIFMDAFATKMATNVMKGLIREHDTHITSNMEVIQTNARPTQRFFQEVDKFEDWRAHIVKSLKSGKKLYIFSPFKSGNRGVAMLTQMISLAMEWKEGDQILAYYAEKEEEKKQLTNVESLWGNDRVRCIITNGTISVGVNFDKAKVFDTIYALYSPMILVRDFLQSLYRVRHPMELIMVLLRVNWSSDGEENERATLPDCKIFGKLREDIKVEREANLNTKTWETFDMFCELANITIKPEKLARATKASREYLQKLQGEVELVFDYSNIKDITEQECEPILYEIYSNRGTIDRRLQIQKFFFKSYFKPDTDPEKVGFVWNHNIVFPSKVSKLHQEPNHIINRLLLENGVALGECFPPTMTRESIPLNEVESAFRFDRIMNYKSGIVSQMLNAFFKMKVYEPDKRKQNNKSRQMQYVTSPEFLKMVATCLSERNGSQPLLQMDNNNDDD
jgi:hypothetical protein